MNLPSCTALMLTRNRRQFLPLAIDCWRRQDYPNKSLLILADGDPVEDLVPMDDPRITLYVLAKRPATIGEKRNIACKYATGEVLANFDDDDLYSPGRLTDQITRLLKHDAMVTGYHSMKFTNGTNTWAYRGPSHVALGATLVFRKEWHAGHPFPAKQINEDTDFGCQAFRHGKAIFTEGFDFLTARIHMGNTSRKCPMPPDWELIA
jgi:O-antigen biosynthesis protein